MIAVPAIVRGDRVSKGVHVGVVARRFSALSIPREEDNYCSDHDHDMTSRSERMYLVAVAGLGNPGPYFL
jgi:hypothetical protein